MYLPYGVKFVSATLTADRVRAIPLLTGGSSRQHRPERPAAENVDVEVRDFLAGIEPDVGEQPIPGSTSPASRAIRPAARTKPAISPSERFRGEVVPGHVSSLGNHKDMGRGQRVDVMKGEHMLVLVDRLRRNLAAKDPREDVIVVIRLGSASIGIA